MSDKVDGVSVVKITITFEPLVEYRSQVLARFRDMVDAEIERAIERVGGTKTQRRAERMRELYIQRHTESPFHQRNRAIYDAYRAGGVRYADLARTHGLSNARIKDIIDKERKFDEVMSKHEPREDGGE